MLLDYSCRCADVCSNLSHCMPWHRFVFDILEEFLLFKSTLKATRFRIFSRKFMPYPRYSLLCKTVCWIIFHPFSLICIDRVVKSGYPPKSLAIVPELPLSSLGLRQGEQIIVGQKAGTASSPAPVSPPKTVPSSGAQTSTSPSKRPPAPRNATSVASGAGIASVDTAQTNPTEQDSVRTEGGFLIHRVSLSRNARGRKLLNKSDSLKKDRSRR